MSLVDEILELTAAGKQDVDRNIASELKQLEEVELALRSVGVTLEPRFNVSLAARIGAGSKTDQSNQLESLRCCLAGR
jgi:hypothetical protein